MIKKLIARYLLKHNCKLEVGNLTIMAFTTEYYKRTIEQVNQRNAEINRYKRKLKRLEELKESEPRNIYHDWDAEIQMHKDNIVSCVMEEEL